MCFSHGYGQPPSYTYSDFGDEGDIDTAVSERQPSGLAATEVFSQTPAGVHLLAGTSSNPLDDLVSIFGGGGHGGLMMSADAGKGISVSGGGQGTTRSGQGQEAEEDLLGLF